MRLELRQALVSYQDHPTVAAHSSQADMVLCFRMAFTDEDTGLREDRPKHIAKSYLRGWFVQHY